MSTPSFDSLLSPGRIAGLELSNRVLMPAMDMNLCVDGEMSDGEIAHYSARAAGGTAMVITGTGAVAWPIGATSLHQPAFSDDRFIPGIRRLADSVHAAGGKLCMQLCHHGKTASVDVAQGRPQLVPSLLEGQMDMSALRDNPMSELMALATATQGKKATHKVADEDDLAWVVDQFAQAARRVQSAGVDAIEIHAAHGYLVHQFLSPLTNKRTDIYGGSLENRARLLIEIIIGIRAVVPEGMPLFVRFSATDYTEGGWNEEDCSQVARSCADAGADLFDISSGGLITGVQIPTGPGYQVPLANFVADRVDEPVSAVGQITDARQAEAILAEGKVEVIMIGRAALRDPFWPLRAAAELGVEVDYWPNQYSRGKFPTA